MRITNVYRQPSQIYRFEFTNITAKYLHSSLVLINNKLYASIAYSMTKYRFLTKVIPYENIVE